METKRCTKCKDVKSVDEFYWSNRSTGRLGTAYKQCSIEYMRAYEKNPEVKNKIKYHIKNKRKTSAKAVDMAERF